MKKKISVILLILVISIIIQGSAFMQDTAETWNAVFMTIIGFGVALAGAPVTQLIKNLFKVEDNIALLIAGAVAAGIAVLELYLSGLLDFALLSVDTFTAMFFQVFGIANVYFQVFKKSDGIMGKKLLLKQ